MPGILLTPSASSVGAITGMKRAYAEIASSHGEPRARRRKVVHQLQHVQSTHHIPDPVSAELDGFGNGKDFFHEQLRRAIAIQCRGVGLERARPDALEQFVGLVDACMS